MTASEQDERNLHHPIGWDGGIPLDCEECGQPWPCSMWCQWCDGNGQTWDPTAMGNVAPCHHCVGGVPTEAPGGEAEATGVHDATTAREAQP